MTSSMVETGCSSLWVLFLSGNDTNFDVGLKVLQALAGIIGLSFAIYVLLLKRKWKREEELAREKSTNSKLEIENLVSALKASLESKIQSTAQVVVSVLERITKLEGAQGGLADNSNLHSLKYSLDNDVSELKREIKSFQSQCAQRHERMSAFGSISDLKSRIDELVRKIEVLEDFRHQSADRYVLMANYQQDIKLITEAISVLRGDLKTMIEMVDKL